MEKIWKTEQLEKIAANTSIFKHIPAEIGNVLYCDTNQPETVKLSDKESKKRKVIAISICSIILLLYWSFFYEHYIWGAIITVIALLVTIGVCDTTFSGTDYFVGNKGFATVSFVDSRDKETYNTFSGVLRAAQTDMEGEAVTPAVTAPEERTFNFEATIGEGWNAENCAFVVYVFKEEANGKYIVNNGAECVVNGSVDYRYNL